MKIGTFKVVPLIGFVNKSQRNLAFPYIVLYLVEPQTTCKCIKFEKSKKSTHPTVLFRMGFFRKDDPKDRVF